MKGNIERKTMPRSKQNIFPRKICLQPKLYQEQAQLR